MTLKTYFKKLSPKYLFFTGLLLSLGLITKHNVPAFAIIFTTAVVTVYTMKNKKYKDFLLYAIGGLIPAIIVVLASFYFGFFKEMVNFTILGVTNFYSITNTHDSLIAIYILLIFIIFAAALLKSKIDIKELCYISGYAIAGLQVVKMEDLFHIICGLLYFVVLFLIVLQDSDFEIKNFIENIKNKKINLKHCVYIMSVIALLISMLLVGIHSFFNYQYMKERSIYKIDSEMYGELKVDKLFYDVITSTTEYIDSHPEDKVVVISEFAKAVSLYYDIHWGVMDMNLIYDGGVNGEEKIIRDMYNYDKLISLQTDAIASNDNLYKYMEDHFEVCDEIIINDKSYYVYQVSGEYQEK